MQAEKAEAQPRACPRHPKMETRLSCSRCGTPVCPQCMVYAVVGIHCPDCARRRPLPPYDVHLSHLIVAGAVGVVGLAPLEALLWAYLPRLLGLLGLLLLVGLGFGTGHLISLVVNRKRGRSLQVIAGGSVALGYLLSLALTPLVLDVTSLFALVLAMVAAVSSLR